MRRGTDYNILVDIPPDAHRCSDNRVYVVLEKRYFKDVQYNKDDRAWLGKAVSDTQMHPNETYKIMYPETLKGVPHLNVPIYVKRTGMYAASLAIGERTGLYEDLINNFGPRSANLIMDYATYSIITKSNVAKDFETEMADKMLFLGESYSDSWINDQFNDVISDNQIQAFKNAWLKHFNSEELANVWLCIDGSNDNCEADIDEAEHGKAKSHKNIDIISFLYAVTETGVPVFSQIYRGSRVDCQGIKEMLAIMEGIGIKPKGFILDRGFCDENCIRLLQEGHHEFVIMMKENTSGFQELLEKYQSEIRLRWKYAIGRGLFGASDRVRLFKRPSLETDASIIWDGKNGVDRINYLIDGLMEAIQAAEIEIRKGALPRIPEKYKAYMRIKPNGDTLELEVLEGVIQSEIEGKGFYGLVTSRPMAAKEANDVYDLRDCSEKQYSLMKTQLGDSAFRAHNLHRIAVREVIAFVASVIRHEIMRKCRNAKPSIDTNTAIKELNLINMNLIGNNRYQVIHNQCRRQKEIMALLGITDDNLDHIAAYETNRLNQKAVHPVQSLSSTAAETAGNGGKTSSGSVDSRMRSHKSDAKTDEGDVNLTNKRGPGRPKGSRNKPKSAGPEPVPKRGPGRPKGSKNKPKSAGAEPTPKRGPGRPKGSKNKPKQSESVQVEKRKPGRPKGSKNKPKT